MIGARVLARQLRVFSWDESCHFLSLVALVGHGHLIPDHFRIVRFIPHDVALRPYGCRRRFQ